MTIRCPECGFMAKTSQGLASHRLIKHRVMSQIAAKQAKLLADSQAVAVARIERQLAEHKTLIKETLEAFTKKMDDYMKAIFILNKEIADKILGTIKLNKTIELNKATEAKKAEEENDRFRLNY